MRCVLVIALQLTRIDVQRQRGICIEVVAGTIVGDPWRRISSAPVGGVRSRIKHTGDPNRATSALVCVASPGAPAWLTRRRHCVGSPDSLTGLGIERTHRASDAKFATGITNEDLASC